MVQTEYLNDLLGIVQNAETPEQRDEAWDEIVNEVEYLSQIEKDFRELRYNVQKVCEETPYRIPRLTRNNT